MNGSSNCTIDDFEDGSQLLRKNGVQDWEERKPGSIKREAEFYICSYGIKTIVPCITPSCNVSCLLQNIRNSHLSKDRHEIPSSILLFNPVVRPS